MYDEAKFQKFGQLIRESKDKGIRVVIISWPEVLGDNYEELVENLSRLADAGLELSIAGRKPAAGSSGAEGKE